MCIDVDKSDEKTQKQRNPPELPPPAASPTPAPNSFAPPPRRKSCATLSSEATNSTPNQNGDLTESPSSELSSSTQYSYYSTEEKT
ncbi:hypothetical protein TRFO_15420 [Tritrichomonas foetus]|uniref:Uncharacterized protein n=1 Tax=Tritrichomonas foetus TaxID=1144522 RepID=A0A1J4KXH7_9EUKA|nr:hypothetical protein TRFO_15420 [Tritrichomonas foetus]|eukprot:OHT14261.1 hypothetical protein TRFO_15420 [Tritrichomonas foetus]